MKKLNKLKIVLADRDKSFVESFGNYVTSSSFRNQFDLKLFTSEETFEQYLSKGHEIDIMLIKEGFTTKNLHNRDQYLLLTLVEHDEKVKEAEIFKYQPLNSLISMILTSFYESFSGSSSSLARTNNTHVLSVFSPSGGSGKTTLAVTMSHQLSLQNYRVFYLNLELYNSTSLYFQTTEDSPSLQVFYYLKARKEQLLAKIEKLKRHDPHMQVDYFDMLPSPDEIMEVSRDDVQLLLQTLVNTGEYDYIVVDLDSSLHDITQGGLKASHQIIWLLNNDSQSFLKSKVLLDSTEDFFEKKNFLAEKATFVLNRFQNQLSEEIVSYHFPIKAYLPFVKEWTDVTDRNSLFYHPVMSKEVNLLIQDIVKGSQAGVPNG